MFCTLRVFIESICATTSGHIRSCLRKSDWLTTNMRLCLLEQGQIRTNKKKLVLVESTLSQEQSLFYFRVESQSRIVLWVSLTKCGVQIGTTKGTGCDVLILEEAAYCNGVLVKAHSTRSSRLVVPRPANVAGAVVHVLLYSTRGHSHSSTRPANAASSSSSASSGVSLAA
jgi:hypothetical protein